MVHPIDLTDSPDGGLTIGLELLLKGQKLDTLERQAEVGYTEKGDLLHEIMIHQGLEGVLVARTHALVHRSGREGIAPKTGKHLNLVDGEHLLHRWLL